MKKIKHNHYCEYSYPWPKCCGNGMCVEVEVDKKNDNENKETTKDWLKATHKPQA